jgi:hypothetical protein
MRNELENLRQLLTLDPPPMRHDNVMQKNTF